MYHHDRLTSTVQYWLYCHCNIAKCMQKKCNVLLWKIHKWMWSETQPLTCVVCNYGGHQTGLWVQTADMLIDSTFIVQSTLLWFRVSECPEVHKEPQTASVTSHYSPSFGKSGAALCDISQASLSSCIAHHCDWLGPVQSIYLVLRGAISFQSKAHKLPQSTRQVLINIQTFAFKSSPIYSSFPSICETWQSH